jgi:acid phosphatase
LLARPDACRIEAPAATYVVMGDFGSGSDAEYEIAAAIQAMAEDEPIAALITTGDNFYNDDVELIWSVPYGWLEEEGVPVQAAWGNHDLETPTRERLVEKHLSPPGRWYQADLGEGTLLILDSNDVGDVEQTEWLSRALANADSPIVVAFHHPVFSCGSHGNSPSIIQSWAPLLLRHDVALVLNGHEHAYQRFERDGVTYVVTGGGGQPIQPAQSCSESTPSQMAADHENNHFLVLQASEDEIVGTAMTANGNVIDSFVIAVRRP